MSPVQDVDSQSGESEDSESFVDESVDGESMELNTPYKRGKRGGRKEEEGRSSTGDGLWERVSMGGKGKGTGTGGGLDQGVGVEGGITVALVCVVGALQRMTVKVPDRSTTRTLILNSVVTVLTALQTVKLSNSPDGKNRFHNVSIRCSKKKMNCFLTQGSCFISISDSI